jgi:hypothetical protein
MSTVNRSGEHDLREFGARMDASLSALQSTFLKHKEEQTKTLVLTFIVTNATFVLAVAMLAFFVARVG